MRIGWVVSALLGLGCGASAPRVDAGEVSDPPAVSADAGIVGDGGVPIVALVAPSAGRVAVDLVRCVTLNGVTELGAVEPLSPDAPFLQLQVGPETVLRRGDRADCSASKLPVQGVSVGEGFVELSTTIAGERRTVRGALSVVPLSGMLVGHREMTLTVGSSEPVSWSASGGSLGVMATQKLGVTFSTPVGEVRTETGVRSLWATSRGTADVTLSYASLPPVVFRLNAVVGIPLSVSRVASSDGMRPRGGRIDRGQCLTLTVLAQFQDGSIHYGAPWPDAPVENLTPATWTNAAGVWCATAEGEASMRSCFGGLCQRFDVWVGPAPRVLVELTGPTQFNDYAGIAQAIPVPLRVTVGEGASAKDVSHSPLVEWLPVQDTSGAYTAFSDENGLVERVQGHVAFRTLSQLAAGTTVEGQVAVRYGGVSAQTATPIRITVVAP